MSTEHIETLTPSSIVDVDAPVKESTLKSGITCDSGVDSADSYSAGHSTTLNSDNLLEDYIDNVKETEGKIHNYALVEIKNSTSSSPISISPINNDTCNNILTYDEFSMNKSDFNINSINHITDDNSMNYDDNDELADNNDDTHADGSIHDSTSDSNDDLQNNDQINSNRALDIKHITSKILTTSTISLNEQIIPNNKNVSICKSPYSRSAENISNINEIKLENTNLNSSTKDLNTDTILSEYVTHKNKASATQIIPEIPQKITENSQTNLDMRYTRLPKELLSQDLGSIVKNVHGIFSSVSGSLKSAYTHRVATQKPPVKIVKPIPNGKFMDDIFEDENIEKPHETHSMEKAVHINSDILNENKLSETQDAEVESDMKRDIIKLQIESLERVLFEQRRENASLRERVKQQADELQAKDLTFKDFESKLDLMTKRVELAEREKDAAVMRYASVECAAIEARRVAEKAAAAERAAAVEVELLNNKIKSAHGEKNRICQMYDDKCHELSNTERELAKVRDDIKELEGRLKWTQSKLRMEIDAYKETAEKAEKLSQQVSELESARETAAVNATDNARAKQLELELKESQAALILCRHEKEELEKRWSTTSGLLDTCRRDRDNASGALSRATAEVERLKLANLRLEEEAAELAALRARAALADTLGVQLQREKSRAVQAEEALSMERARAETCSQREAEALEHAASLTARHVALSAISGERETKAQALSADNTSLRERISSLESECTKLKEALAEETERRNKENRVLARKVAELTEEVAEASKKLEWEKGENGVLKKKHASAIKELNRELQRSLKRCEQLEAKLPPPDAASTRTGSISSLSSSESAPQEERLQNGHTDALPDIQVREPDRQALIERIVSLQRAAARRSERCEFLEEHSRQLTDELRNKARLLRHLLCALPAGAVSSRDSDAHKKEIARLGGGAMAAVWGGDPTGMTLDLSLEMNKRLQAVLEDALLKNITLKENMDTLGLEIARLKDQKKSTTDSK